MLVCSLAAAVAVALTWSFTPAVAVTLVLFAASGALVATRTVSGTVYGFSVAGELGREVGTVRAVTTQLGYLIGALVGGAAIAIGGFALLGVAMGGLLLASTLPYAARDRRASEGSRAALPARRPDRCRRGLSSSGTARSSPSGRCGTATSRPSWPCSIGSASGRAARASTGRSRGSRSAELAHLAAVDATRHALVGYVKGDDRPVAIARLVRDGSSAEIAFEVADEHPAARHRLGAHRGAARRRARGGDHRGHGARLERQRGGDVAAAPASERARGSLRGSRAVGARGARVSLGLEETQSPRGAAAPARGSA